MWRNVPSTPAPRVLPPAGIPELPQPTAPAAPTIVPTLVGLSSTEARRIARTSGLLVEIEDALVDPERWGLVLEQWPAPGQAAESTSIVRLSVGARPHVTVPDIRGREEDAALSILREAGLGAVRRATRRSSPVPEGSVLRTRPRAGTEIVLGSTVSYVLAAGPPESRRNAGGRRRRRPGRMPDSSFMSLPAPDRPRDRG